MNPESPNPLLVLLAALLSILAIALATACSDEDPEGGASGDTSLLTELIDAADEGDTVLVPAGTYYESVEVSKPLTLKPAGDGRVIIDGRCELATGISVPSASNVTISGIEVRNVTGAAVLIGNGPEDEPRAEHVAIDSMTISDYNCQDGDDHYNAGIAVYYSGCCVRITNNAITYRSAQPDARGYGDGIWFKSNSERPSGGGHYIAGNTISGGWDSIGGESEDDPHGSFDGNTTIENNTVGECWDDGIQVEGGDDRVIVRNNTITGCGTGIALAPVLAGPLTIERNVIRDLELGRDENQFCFKVGDNSKAVAYLTENICQTEGLGVLQTNEGPSWLVLQGNCFSVTGSVFEVGDLAEGSSMDGDYLWTTSESRFVAWRGTQYFDITEFRTTGNELNGQQSPNCPLTIG